MIYLDLYGFWKPPKEIIKIIEDKRFTRLYDLTQNGPARYIINTNQNRNRGNHSLGVAYIISILGGSIEEMIAGLIHDIAHLPFSHAIDVKWSKKNHDTHERIDLLEKVLKNWKVGDYNLLEIAFNMKKEKYKIMDNEQPRVCADRLEYALRDAYYLGYISIKEIKDIINDIKFNDQEITFSRKNAIKLFEIYFKLNYNHYLDEKEAAAHAIYGKIIDNEIKKGKLNTDKLLRLTDTELNQYLIKEYPWLDRIKYMTVIPGNEYELNPKFRIIDPLTHNGKRVSKFYQKFNERKRLLKEKAKPKRVNITF